MEPENRTKLMTNGMLKIDNLQRQMIEDAKKLISQAEIEQFKEIFAYYQASLKPIIEQAKNVAVQNQKLFQMDNSTKKMTEDSVRLSQEIEGYSMKVSKQMQKEIERIRKQHKLGVVLPRKE
jgi:N-formylglutamate amidohydrolase